MQKELVESLNRGNRPVSKRKFSQVESRLAVLEKEVLAMKKMLAQFLTPKDELAELKEKAKSLGIKVDGRMKKETIKKAIEELENVNKPDE